MLDRLEFVFSEAWTALRRNTWMTFAAVTTAAVALFLLGGLGYAYVSVSTYMRSLPSRFEIRVFLRNGIAREQVSEAAREIRQISGVRKLVWIPKEQAWAKFRSEYPDLTQGEDNPLPDSFRVSLVRIDDAPQVAAQIRSLAAVDPQGVKYLDDLQQMLSDALVLLRAVGFGVGGLLLLTSGVLIFNTIRLTIVSRRREIRIMQLVGATRATVASPLLIEGIIQGTLGGLVASFLLWSCNAGIQRLLASLSAIGNLPSFPLAAASMILMAIGALYGFVCSLIAVRESPRRSRQKA